jgi:amino acid adenylation domain-containing protein
VDRAALPAPGRAAAGLPESATAPPRTPAERALAAIVTRLLGGVRVGVTDDFFALGGNSLLAGRLAAEIAAELAVPLSLADVYRAPTVSAIATLIDEQAAVPVLRLDSPPPLPSRLPVGSTPRDQAVPLSLQQQRVWFFEQLAPGNLAYTTQATVSLRGQVDTGALRAALDEIVRRHEVLRTAFVTVDGVPVQRVVTGVTAPLRVVDVPPELAEDVIAAELRRPFDLTRPPLARWVLVRYRDGENTLVCSEHHIVHDGWSQGVLLSELGVLYQAFAAGQRSPLPEPAAQYADYARWQREWMRGEVLKAHVDHGVARLAGAPHVLELPADHPRPRVKSFRGAAPRIEVPAELSRALRSFSRRHRVSLFATMYAGFAALLYRYTGQQDVLVGTGAANRGLPELQQMLGMLVNTLVLRTRVGGQMPFSDLLDQVQQTLIDTLAWPDTPVDAVIDAIGPARDASRTPLFQVIFTFHDSAVPDLDFGGLTGAVTERENGAAMCDLTVMVVPRAAQRLGREPRPEDDDLTLVWEYSTDLFDEPTMTRMAGHYLNLLTSALAAPSTRIGDLRLLAGSDLAMLGSWSRGPAAGYPADGAGYPADATIPARFAAQVRANPDATAVAFGGTAISYAELDRRSNALAWRLRRRGVSTDTPVAVAIERGPDLITALLAVLKAGGGYLPVDPASPAPRVAAMINAAGARLVLATGTDLPQLPAADVIRVDGIGRAEPASAPDGRAAPPDAAHPLSLAYVCFTSGSTGVPKGVAVPQRAVIRLISNPTFGSLGPGQRVLHLAPVAFDASTLEIWGALLTGGTVVVAPPGPLSLSEIAALLRADVTVAWLTAALFDQVAETDIDAIAGVPLVLTGGDTLTPDTVRAVLAARRGRALVNGYGPTENTTFTTCQVLTDPGQAGTAVPIGRPIQHTTVHILDDRGQPVPVGVTGELYTGGDGLARGYAGNPAATARAFVPDPTGHGTRLYRTGDLARWRGDGVIEFAGRADDQVKIRGFRVEPGEVAAVLRSHPAVRDAVVIVAGEGGQRHLIGYVTPADGQDPGTLPPARLRDFLARRLPDYLIPAAFKAVARLPVNASGKVDRGALPAPDHVGRGTATPPRGATEERLAELWSVLLPEHSTRGGIGREDDFFTFGGDSLLAARLIFRIAEAFGVELGLAAFYQSRTLAACAAAIDAARDQAAPAAIGRRDRTAYRVAAPRARRPEQEG